MGQPKTCQRQALHVILQQYERRRKKKFLNNEIKGQYYKNTHVMAKTVPLPFGIMTHSITTFSLISLTIMI
jgi:hypothetical protein